MINSRCHIISSCFMLGDTYWRENEDKEWRREAWQTRIKDIDGKTQSQGSPVGGSPGVPAPAWSVFPTLGLPLVWTFLPQAASRALGTCISRNLWSALEPQALTSSQGLDSVLAKTTSFSSGAHQPCCASFLNAGLGAGTRKEGDIIPQMNHVCLVI